jgi:hypothetical protein
MAKRGRPRKNPKPEEVKKDLKKEKEVQDFVSEGIEPTDNTDISDVDYTKEEPKVDAPKSPLGQSYNPFAESVEEKAYRSVKVEDSPMIGDISEPVFERPTFQDLVKDNEEQVEEDGIGGENNPFSQDEIRELPDKQKEDAAKGLVEQTLNMYALGCKGLGSLAKISEKKVNKLSNDGLIDTNIRIPIDAHTSVSIPQVVQGFNSEIDDTFQVDDDFKDSVRPAMTRVFIKRGWGMTDEQQLLLAFGMDIAQKGAIVMKLRKEGDMQLKRFMEMTDYANGKKVNFVTEDAPVTPAPQNDEPVSEEPQMEVVKKKRGRKNKKENDMVSTINPDLNVSKHDLDQIDVDNV